MELAAGAGMFRAKWTDRIHDEWTRSVLANRPDLTAEQVARTRHMMNQAVPGCLVENYEELGMGLTLPDPDDVHVLAAAIQASSNAIITFNLKDFPKKSLAQYDIEPLHPDEFLFHQFGLNTSAVIVSAQRCRERLKNPPKSADDYLDTLETQGLPKTIAELRQYRDVI